MNAVRDRRLECALTQRQLAERAGVSRQLVAAVEAGRNTPAVDAALALAGALGATVEELFEPATPDVVPAIGERLREGASLRIGRLGEQLVAAELPDHGVAGATWARADGVTERRTLRRFPGAVPAGVVVAGCDPALGIAEAMLAGLGPRSLLAVSAPTGVALRALDRGRVHAALVHGLADELAPAPVPVARWHFTRWRVGVAISSRLRARSLEALVDGDVPVVQRDPAAASQRAFERARAAVAGIGSGVGMAEPAAPLATGHLDAARMAAILGTAAVTTEGAAHAFDLAFVPLEDHTVEIWIDRRWTDTPGIEALGSLLATAAFTQRVARIGGYDLTGCGGPVGHASPHNEDST
jgi:DNA-binding XRE family transcriptional regulator